MQAARLTKRRTRRGEFASATVQREGVHDTTDSPRLNLPLAVLHGSRWPTSAAGARSSLRSTRTPRGPCVVGVSVVGPPHVAGHGGAPSPALARRRPSEPPPRADAPPARVLPLEGTSHLSEGCRASSSPRSLSSIRGPRRRRARTRARDERPDAAPCSSSALRDRSRALSRPHRRGTRGSPAHGTAASSQRALSSSEIASPPDARGALSPRTLPLGAAQCSPPRRDAESPPPPRARRAVRRVAPLVLSANTCCC